MLSRLVLLVPIVSFQYLPLAGEPTVPPAQVPCGIDTSTDPSTIGDIFPPYPVNDSPRPTILRPWQKDYLVITYDAKLGTTYWYDYATRHGGLGTYIPLTKSGAFTPITYTREKIIVRVCNAHFGSNISATPSFTTIPEAVPEIRGQGGGAPSGLGGATPNAAPGPGAAPPPLSTGVTPLLQLIPASEIKLAQAAATYDAEYKQLSILPQKLLSNGSRDTIPSLQQRADNLNSDGRFTAVDRTSNVAAFNDLFAKTQALANDVSNLETTANTATISAALQQLNSDYAALLLLYKGYVSAQDQNKAAAVANAQAVKDSADRQVRTASRSQLPEAIRKQQSASAALTAALNDLTTFRADSNSYVNNAISPFLLQYNNSTDLSTILQQDIPATPTSQLSSIQSSLTHLHTTTSHLFDQVNSLHDESNIATTTMVTPQTTNNIVTIAITVQDTYTPFTFASASGQALLRLRVLTARPHPHRLLEDLLLQCNQPPPKRREIKRTRQVRPTLRKPQIVTRQQ